jgi:hypothetical protein
MCRIREDARFICGFSDSPYIKHQYISKGVPMKKNNNKSESSLRSFTTLAIVIANSILLASCGGGDGSSVAAPDTTSLAVRSGVTVPSGWTGRAPKYEVINGITVPPEPSPALNNATLTGIDVNNNGVRDDVERIIAIESGGNDDKIKVYNLAANSAQKLMVSQSAIDAKKYDCARSMLNEIESSVLHNIVINNQTRSELYNKLKPKNGAVTIISVSNNSSVIDAKTDCIFN